MVSPTLGRSRARRNQLSWNGGSASPGSAGRAGRRRPARRPVAWNSRAFANTLDVEAGTDELSSPRALDERLAARDLTRSARPGGATLDDLPRGSINRLYRVLLWCQVSAQELPPRGPRAARRGRDPQPFEQPPHSGGHIPGARSARPPAPAPAPP